MRVGIAFGSNLGDRLRNLQRARDAICARIQIVPPLLQSSVYETSPIDCEPGAANFYNAAIEIGTGQPAVTVLKLLHEIEATMGRKRNEGCNVSRLIDLDLLYWDRLEVDEPCLQLPHPRIANREFVLRPLADFAPDLQLPGQTATVRELLVNIVKSARCVIEQW